MLEEGQTGFCRGRENKNGEIICSNYGKVTSIALDPIEKKPLSHFMPLRKILSVGSFGCNMRCPFCQNYRITMVGSDIETTEISPAELAQKAVDEVEKGNVGVAYTYNEPFISYEYVRDCCIEVRKVGLVNVLVTNGYVCEQPLRELLPYVNAMNIDLKCFNEAFYKKLDGDFETVKRTITIAQENCHVEVTALIIPGENDSKEEMKNMSSWLSSLNPNIPLHISKFFPNYQWKHLAPTPEGTIYSLAEIALRKLSYVYMGNV